MSSNAKIAKTRFMSAVEDAEPKMVNEVGDVIDSVIETQQPSADIEDVVVKPVDESTVMVEDVKTNEFTEVKKEKDGNYTMTPVDKQMAEKPEDKNPEEKLDEVISTENLQEFDEAMNDLEAQGVKDVQMTKEGKTYSVYAPKGTKLSKKFSSTQKRKFYSDEAKIAEQNKNAVGVDGDMVTEIKSLKDTVAELRAALDASMKVQHEKVEHEFSNTDKGEGSMRTFSANNPANKNSVVDAFATTLNRFGGNR